MRFYATFTESHLIAQSLRQYMKKPAIFLDRDGTILYDVGYIKDSCHVSLLPGVGIALITMQKLGYLLIIVSNQSGVGRGWITETQADQVHQRMIHLLYKQGVKIDASYYCYHEPEAGCECRKPRPGMLKKAIKDYDVDISNSFMIGDKLSDIEAGVRAGLKTILLAQDTSPKTELLLLQIFPDWSSVIYFFLDRANNDHGEK